MEKPCKTYTEAFFARPTPEVAQDLIGAVLNRRLSQNRILTATICEVEAYTADDPACHAYKGETDRCRVMFGPPGRAYVYFIYGMYYCLNVVTEQAGVAGAVLIRGLLGDGLNGPGKICREWQIDRTFNGMNLLNPSSDLWLSKPGRGSKHFVEVSPRIGISKGKERMWRFYVRPQSSGDEEVAFKLARR